jgi:hypothetical protein
MKIAIKSGKDEEPMCRNPQKKEVRMTQAPPEIWRGKAGVGGHSTAKRAIFN